MAHFSKWASGATGPNSPSNHPTLTEMTDSFDKQIFLRDIQYPRKHCQGSHMVDKVEAILDKNWMAEKDDGDRYK